MWRTRPCDRRDPGTGNGATNSKLPRPSIKAATDHAGPLRTPFPSRRLRFLKPRQVVVCLVEPRSNGIARETRRLPPKTLEFSCRPPKIVPSPRKFTEDAHCDTGFLRSTSPHLVSMHLRYHDCGTKNICKIVGFFACWRLNSTSPSIKGPQAVPRSRWRYVEDLLGGMRTPDHREFDANRSGGR